MEPKTRVYNSMPVTGRGRIVSRRELAEIHRVVVTTIDAWINRNCPVIQRANRATGKQWKFNTRDIAKWREEQSALNAVGDTAKLDIGEARRRKIAAEAALVELEVARARREQIPAELVIYTWQAMTANARARLLALPSKIVGAAISATSPHDIEAAARDLVYEAVEELAGSGLPDEVRRKAEDYDALKAPLPRKHQVRSATNGHGRTRSPAQAGARRKHTVAQG